MSVYLGFLHGCLAQSIGVEYLWQAVSPTKPKISKIWPFTERILLTPGLEKYLCFNIFSSNPPRLRSYVSYFMDGKNLRPREVRQFIQSSVATKSSLSELGPRSLDSKGYVLWFHPSNKRVLSCLLTGCVLSHSVMSDSVTLWTIVCQVPHLWASPGKNTGVGCLAFLQGIFLIQRYKLCLVYLLHRQTGSLPLALPGKPLFLLQNSWTKSQGREKVVNYTDLHPNTEYFLPHSVSKNLRTLDVTCANYLYFEQYMSVWRFQASVKLHKIFGSIVKITEKSTGFKSKEKQCL